MVEVVAGDTLKATVTGGTGSAVRFVKNGAPLDAVPVDTDPFVHELVLEAPASGQDRYRAEVLVGDNPRTVTSHVWLGPPTEARRYEASGGCGCRMQRRDVSPMAWISAICAAILTTRARRALGQG